MAYGPLNLFPGVFWGLSLAEWMLLLQGRADMSPEKIEARRREKKRTEMKAAFAEMKAMYPD